MINKHKHDDIIEQLELLVNQYEDSGYKEQIEVLKLCKERFDIKVMVVGAFNAGKSSILNGLLRRPEFLEEAQVPQTAIATELKYSEVERAVAYTFNGQVEELSANKTYDSEKYQRIKYELPIANLNELCDFTVVDTPGYDSGVEAHNKAISQYIGKGSVYLYVIDQEKGGLDSSSLNQLKELACYTSRIAVLVNKCDKITPSNIENIVNSVKTTLELNGFDFDVYPVSKKMKDIDRKLIEIIQQFDPQEAYDEKMSSLIQENIKTIKSTLEITQNNLFLDTFSFEKDIYKYKKAREAIEDSFIVQEKRLKEALSEDSEKVMTNIKAALRQNSGTIISGLMHGNQTAVEASIFETIRPVMISELNSTSYNQIDSIAKGLDLTGFEREDDTVLNESIHNIGDAVKALINEDSYFYEAIDDYEKMGIRNFNNETYLAIAGSLASVTNFIAPALEVVIIAAPFILKLGKDIFSESEEVKQAQKFNTLIVPQVCNKIRPNVEEAITNSTNVIICNFKEKIEDQLKTIEDNLNYAKMQKEKSEVDFKEYRSRIEKDIITLDELLDK